MDVNATLSTTENGSRLKYFFYVPVNEYDPDFRRFKDLCHMCRSVNDHITDEEYNNITIEYMAADTLTDTTLMSIYNWYQYTVKHKKGGQ